MISPGDFDWRDSSQWARYLFYLGLAGFAGTMGFIFRQLQSESKLIWWRILLEGFAAAFVGLLFMWLCEMGKFGPQLTGIIVAVAGWMGAQASMGLLEKFVFQKLNIGKRINKQLDKDSGEGK